MFITRVKINYRRRGAVKLLTNPRAMHAAVEQGFPDDDHGRVLWRVDKHDHAHHLLVVSPQRPDLTHIVEQAGWDTAPPEVKDYDTHLARLHDGMKVRFQITANPVHRDHTQLDSRGRGKIYGHVTVAQQIAWLSDRQERLGLHFESVDVTDRGRQEALRPNGEKRDDGSGTRRKVTHDHATFLGTATITHADQLREALVTGLGRGRAYGLSMLTVVPA